MFNKITPEQAGISSENVVRFIKILNKRGLATHSVLMMHGDDIFAEYYWKPFNKDFCHRMYSQTKSYVGIAIGLLQEDGLLNIDDRIAQYFPDKIEKELPAYLAEQTIRDMLTMQTCGETPYWFYNTDPDRTHLYLNENSATIPSGMRFKYDSPGSQVLSSLVERLSGKSLFDYLNEKLFCHLGTFKTASILKTPNGDSFGDSALLCTTRDMASFARLLMNGGAWNGKRLINEDYVNAATSCQVDNAETPFDEAYTQGYGYQIWRMWDNAFSFNGMGCQLTLCLPDKDFIFVITSDNQGYAAAKSLIYAALYDIIIDNISDAPLPENEAAYNVALALENELELNCIKGNVHSPFANELSQQTYICEQNPTGITKFSFVFNDDETGEFHYTNAQGDKVLNFGLAKNVFGKFPQYGYSDEYCCIPTDNGHLYDCAVSAVWREENKLLLKVQIIDKYLGNMLAIFSFKSNYATVSMVKNAEAFLDEYQGEFVATIKNR